MPEPEGLFEMGGLATEVFEEEKARAQPMWDKADEWKDKGWAPVYDEEELFKNFGSLAGNDYSGTPKDKRDLRIALGFYPEKGDQVGVLVSERLKRANIPWDGSVLHAVEALLQKGDKQGLLSRTEGYKPLKNYVRQGLMEVEEYRRANVSVDEATLHRMTRKKIKTAMRRAEEVLMNSHEVLTSKRGTVLSSGKTTAGLASLDALFNPDNTADVLMGTEGMHGFSSVPAFSTASKKKHILKLILDPSEMLKYRQEAAAPEQMTETQKGHFGALLSIQESSYGKAFGTQGIEALHTGNKKGWNKTRMAKALEVSVAELDVRLNKAHMEVVSSDIDKRVGDMEDNSPGFDLGVKDLDAHITEINAYVRATRLKEINASMARAQKGEYANVLKAYGESINVAAQQAVVLEAFRKQHGEEALEKVIKNMGAVLKEPANKFTQALQVALVSNVPAHKISQLAIEKAWPTIVNMVTGNVLLGGEQVRAVDEIGKYVFKLDGTKVMSLATTVAYRLLLEDPKLLPPNFRMFGKGSMDQARKKTLQKRLASVAFMAAQDYLNRYAEGLGAPLSGGRIEEAFDLRDAADSMVMFMRRKSKVASGGNIHNYHRYFFELNAKNELDYSSPLPRIDEEFLSHRDAMRLGRTEEPKDFKDPVMRMELDDKKLDRLGRLLRTRR